MNLKSIFERIGNTAAKWQALQGAAGETDRDASIRTFELNEETFRGVIRVVEGRETAPGVMSRGDELFPLDVVAESFYQEDLTLLANGKPGEECGWYSGFLITEPRNEYDPNAVAVYLIHKRQSELEVFKVGYLPKDLARKASKPISDRLLHQGEVVPILGRLLGGDAADKNFYGVAINAFWDLSKSN